MSEFHVEVVRIGLVEKHANADSLSITKIHGGYPVIFRTGEYNEGDLATYVPVDSIVPDTETWKFLGGHRRIKAKRLRGVFSMGLLTPAPEGTVEGENVQELLGITKWEPDVEREGFALADTAPSPNCLLGLGKYDLEGYRKYGAVLEVGELVRITEKVHGANFRAVYWDNALHVGSRTRWLKEVDGSLWWKAARFYDLEAKMRDMPGVVLFAEVYGQVQDLKYGVPPNEVRLVAFDIWSMDGGWGDIESAELPVPIAPVLYKGPWSPEVDVAMLAEGNSLIPGANNVREGIVIEAVPSRENDRIGRVKLKLAGEGYLTRKGSGA